MTGEKDDHKREVRLERGGWSKWKLRNATGACLSDVKSGIGKGVCLGVLGGTNYSEAALLKKIAGRKNYSGGERGKSAGGEQSDLLARRKR